ncbi:peptide chain release factor N(5)-glutamine methyltransferase [Halobacillus salinus]|uniref:peptide chain release factor N(5)-glutamine methyltransferase n=1 Tax=Halobacillus salinus TaxID=192814 RepID=UPI0009A6190E|nr:peptide chain release factor N(5)-glutamine methyltransferase [Halobacillus salinus]
MNNTFTTIEEARRWASVFLRENGRESRVADLLLEHYLALPFAKLLASGPDPFPEEQRDRFVRSIEQHAETGVPVQHIIGTAPFYGREFHVNENVLIPRPETEELVVGVVDMIRKWDLDNPKVVDVGTGSGVIAITIALEQPDVNMIASDISTEALQVAKSNSHLHEAGVDFLQGNFLEPLQGQAVDIVVSNPPYIAYHEKETMDDTVVDFDPELALFTDQEGLAAYQTIVEQISGWERKPYLIAFEIGYQQGEAVTNIIEGQLDGYDVEVRQDLNGKDRMIFAVLKEK